MDTTKHTPVWHVAHGDPTHVFVSDVVKPINCGSQKRALEIVIACNAHDNLVEALRAVVARLDQPVLSTTSGDGVANILRADIRAALHAAHAALAKVSA